MMFGILDAIHETTGELDVLDFPEPVASCKHGKSISIVFAKKDHPVCPYCLLEAQVALAMDFVRKHQNEKAARDILAIIDK